MSDAAAALTKKLQSVDEVRAHYDLSNEFFQLIEIFPGGRLPTVEKVVAHSMKAGYKLTGVQSLQSNFAKTLDMWADVLEFREDEALAIQSEEVYERYMKFLRGTAEGFCIGFVDINQFTLEK